MSWSDASAGAVVLGCYEAQLHSAIEELVELQPDLLVNIGAAEGAYAVGLARRLPGCEVLAVDIDPAARKATASNARLNDVADRVRPAPALDASQLEVVLQQAKCPAVFIDCEGCEADLIDLDKVPALARSYILVEVHEHVVPGLQLTLCDRLHGTHQVEVIAESGRDPHRYEVLRSVPSDDKWLAVSEGRPQTMVWLWCVPAAMRR